MGKREQCEELQKNDKFIDICDFLRTNFISNLL